MDTLLARLWRVFALKWQQRGAIILQRRTGKDRPYGVPSCDASKIPVGAPLAAPNTLHVKLFDKMYVIIVNYLT